MSPQMFQLSLYASLVLCAVGLAWRVATWLQVGVGPEARSVAFSQRLTVAWRGLVTALFSRQLWRVLAALLWDVLLQRRLYANAKLRWLGHLLIVAGFTLLLLTHALAPMVAPQLFPAYQPTLEPYLLLRNLGGVLVFGGAALLFLGRRRREGGFAPLRRPGDRAFAGLLGLVLVTGFLLEAHKMASPRAFYRMTEQYLGTADPRQLEPLRALWASEFGLATGDLTQPIAPQLVEAGRGMHRDACASCHARPVSAFVSYPFARVLAPLADRLDRADAEYWLLHLHLFACFLGLASLPFTLFLHVVAAPLSLLVNAAAPGASLSAAGRATRRALALDACVRCGICDTRCSVAPLARYLGNAWLLPSQKLAATKAWCAGPLRQSSGAEGLFGAEAALIAEGAFLCTDCGRCTSLCPVGLDLEDLWQAGRADLAAAGLPAPALRVQARSALDWAQSLKLTATPAARFELDARYAPLSADRRAFSRCVQCQTCTNVCPVVAYSREMDRGLDLTPQKVMNLLRLGLGEFALGSRMVWSCATCYQCQEHCPEGIRVADIMCELRALALRRPGAVDATRVQS